jgi:hypothetical protein
MDVLAPERVAGSRIAAVALAVWAGATIAGAVGGCGYRSGSFRGAAGRDAFAGERATIGCLDVAVAGRWSPSPAIAQAVQVDFGNRCDRPVVVDFTAVRAVGRDDGGRELALAIHDPRREIRPLSLEARTVGREVIELRPAAGPGPAPARMRSACVDVGRLADGAMHAPRWLCVSRPAGRLAATGGAP